MVYEIPEYKLAEMLATAVELGAQRALQEHGIAKAQISQREAYRRHGRARVMTWKREGKTTPVKIGGKVYYNSNDLEILTKINKLTNGTGTQEGGSNDPDFQPGDPGTAPGAGKNTKQVEHKKQRAR